MSSPLVTATTIDEPIVVIGKHFTGSYSRSQQFVLDVQEALKKENIDFAPNKVMGIFYDNPQQTSPDNLRSFHSVFPHSPEDISRTSMEKFALKGKFLQVAVKGNPTQSIMEGYGALFSYINQNNILLKSTTGYQISTFENDEITTEILFELE